MKFVHGNIFDSDCDILVNTINCVGVMGKGVALECKKRFPQNFKEYWKACKDEQIHPGEIFIFQENGKTIINLATKNHWKNSSRLEWVEKGTIALARLLRASGGSTIAIPPLGCGNGNLKWQDVRPILEKYLSDIPDVEICIFEPESEISSRDSI
ncbi:MAG: Appr-1-p processing domain protein [Candidatus Woesebacteria bacterium GW2011_GWB1_39_12]|uniref:Appr-1-p processing domain protein n=1 Tax=Candidatus Woesebacteria bacterium GW2011_GWB1_39_12 TaxID=1618574 RepID=A0A0G0MI32_9BACT|nr:MAG: Appr-1-p processing domain protein [Candidatus Woesebacteria bacterium GW2011_GWB1_39_12]